MSRPGDLLPRLGVALVGAPLAIAAIFAGGWIMGAVVAGIAAVATSEFYALARLQGARPFALLGAASSGALVLLATAQPSFSAVAGAGAALVLILGGLVMTLSLFMRWPGGSPSTAFASTLAGVAYVGAPLSFFPLLRALPDSIPGVEAMSAWVPVAFVFFPLLCTWASDTFAYFVGHAVGRVKLAPTVSPGKSVEGSLGGIVGAMVVGGFMAHLWLADLPAHSVSMVAGALLGAAVSVAGQIGDLVESVLKREAGVKDSGSLLPGHGGFLDRIDALLWALPLTWGLLYLMGAL